LGYFLKKQVKFARETTILLKYLLVGILSKILQIYTCLLNGVQYKVSEEVKLILDKFHFKI
jgi:hypothetical protein